MPIWFITNNLNRMTKFANKTIWITGASSGIGESLALMLAERDNTLILSSRNKASLEKVKAKCEAKGSSCYISTMDLSNPESIESAANDVLSKYTTIDLLINNGGISQRSYIQETPVSLDRKIMEINYFGQIALTKKVLPVMVAQKSGHIAVTSSIVGIFGFPLRSAYSASKHALHGFFETLKIEQKENNINVSIIVPGRIHTKISFNAVTKEGVAQGIMDHGQNQGMDADVCAKKIIGGIEKKKFEILVGGKELLMVYFRRYLTRMFFKIAGKVQPT